MPVTTSAKGALRKDKRRAVVNQKVREAMKAALKQAREKKTAVAVSKAYSAVDRAAKSKVIHKNKAARLKSRLVKQVGLKTVKPKVKAKTKVKVKKAAKSHGK